MHASPAKKASSYRRLISFYQIASSDQYPIRKASTKIEHNQVTDRFSPFDCAIPAENEQSWMFKIEQIQLEFFEVEKDSGKPLHWRMNILIFLLNNLQIFQLKSLVNFNRLNRHRSQN